MTEKEFVMNLALDKTNNNIWLSRLPSQEYKKFIGNTYIKVKYGLIGSYRLILEELLSMKEKPTKLTSLQKKVIRKSKYELKDIVTLKKENNKI